MLERRKPSEGYAALLGEASFRGDASVFSLCTNVYIVGPHKDTGEVRILSRPWPAESLE